LTNEPGSSRRGGRELTAFFFADEEALQRYDLGGGVAGVSFALFGGVFFARASFSTFVAFFVAASTEFVEGEGGDAGGGADDLSSARDYLTCFARHFVLSIFYSKRGKGGN
jgi:hypothetical protein